MPEAVHKNKTNSNSNMKCYCYLLYSDESNQFLFKNKIFTEFMTTGFQQLNLVHIPVIALFYTLTGLRLLLIHTPMTSYFTDVLHDKSNRKRILTSTSVLASGFVSVSLGVC